MDFERAPLKQLEEAVESFRRCIRCGSCTATCSATQFTDFNIRKIHTAFRAGIYNELEEMLKCCMLCGKCTLVCPRGINLRSLVIHLRKIIKENEL
jgi:heterodisulfide reductase subunit C